MSNWDAEHYLKFGDERTRAAADLVARIQLDEPRSIVDLGCGPGNSTQLLRNRWPDATIVGIDNSQDMLRSAGEAFPQQEWQFADITAWSLEANVDLLYSNAALQWIPGHKPLVQRLFDFVSGQGALAFQIPSSTFAEVRTLIHEISRDPQWDARMEVPRNALTMETPSFYYDALAKQAGRLDIWETEYQHVMESTEAIVDWIASTGLRPFLGVLHDDQQRNAFLDQLRCRVDAAYETRVDGKVLYPFRRTFVIAYR